MCCVDPYQINSVPQTFNLIGIRFNINVSNESSVNGIDFNLLYSLTNNGKAVCAGVGIYQGLLLRLDNGVVTHSVYSRKGIEAARAEIVVFVC